jgi:hypothetical protein
MEKVLAVSAAIPKMGSMRQCRNHLCRQLFTPSPRFPKAKYCVSCTIDRDIVERRRKFHNNQKHKAGAIERRNERHARRKLKKRVLGAYPSKGFAAVRKRMYSITNKCAVTGITEFEHQKKFKGESLHLDHIIPAKIVAASGLFPHDQRNLMWLSHDIHAQKKAAEEQLKGKGGNYGFVQFLRERNFPTEPLVVALKYAQIYSENLPF